MEISKEKVVSITYELRQDNENGELVEKVTVDQPLTFIYGIGGMLPKFEENLDGKKTGESFNFGLNSEEAYGPVVENAVVDVPIDVFKVDGKIDDNMLKTGNMIPMMDNSGNRLNGKVIEIKESAITMDFNHPMAGKDLYFSGKVTEVREATPDELSHGHVHGKDNCENGDCDDQGENGCNC
ncbi:MAG: FKBP-type peptidyl-prolyl cis-trans isomerase [Bacteroidales bacterium]|nr:FKBP-type peptidyl-prolyl cis-trans isomerase [Bacteroidales bacterium]